MRSTTLTGLRVPLLYVVPRVRLKPLMPMDTDFYAWGHEMNQISVMPGTKVVVFCAPKYPQEPFRASNLCGSMPLASARMLTYALGYKYG